jgi:hypothetical protein
MKLEILVKTTRWILRGLEKLALEVIHLQLHPASTTTCKKQSVRLMTAKQLY